MEDRLRVLLRLRRAALDDARLAFGEALAAEDIARRDADAIADQIEEETRHATEGTDRDVEMFGIWLKQAKSRLRTAELRVAEAEAVSAHKRADITLVRAALEATEAAIAERARVERSARERAQQLELDEMGLPQDR